MENILKYSTEKEIISTLLANTDEAILNYPKDTNNKPIYAREILANSIHLQCFISSKKDAENYSEIMDTIKKVDKFIQRNAASIVTDAVSNLENIVTPYTSENEEIYYADKADTNKTNIREIFMDIFNIDLCYSAIFSNSDIVDTEYSYPNNLMDYYDNNIELFFYIESEVKILFDSYDENLGWDRPEIFAALSVPCQLLERYREVSGDGDMFTEEEVKEIVAAIIELEKEAELPLAYSYADNPNSSEPVTVAAAGGDDPNSSTAATNSGQTIQLVSDDSTFIINIKLEESMLVRDDGKEPSLNNEYAVNNPLEAKIDDKSNTIEKLYISNRSEEIQIAGSSVLLTFGDLKDTHKSDNYFYVKSGISNKVILAIKGIK